MVFFSCFPRKINVFEHFYKIWDPLLFSTPNIAEKFLNFFALLSLLRFYTVFKTVFKNIGFT